MENFLEVLLDNLYKEDNIINKEIQKNFKEETLEKYITYAKVAEKFAKGKEKKRSYFFMQKAIDGLEKLYECKKDFLILFNLLLCYEKNKNYGKAIEKCEYIIEIIGETHFMYEPLTAIEYRCMAKNYIENSILNLEKSVEIFKKSAYEDKNKYITKKCKQSIHELNSKINSLKELF